MKKAPGTYHGSRNKAHLREVSDRKRLSEGLKKRRLKYNCKYHLVAAHISNAMTLTGVHDIVNLDNI